MYNILHQQIHVFQRFFFYLIKFTYFETFYFWQDNFISSEIKLFCKDKMQHPSEAKWIKFNPLSNKEGRRCENR